MIPEWDWGDVKDEFIFDGSWRDIYVLETDSADWQQVIDIVGRQFDARFTVDGEPASLPTDIAQVQKIRSHATPHLWFEVGGVRLNCHFFGLGQIEFDLDPREVTSIGQVDALTSFMATLGHATQKSVVLTPENFQEFALFKYFAERNAVFWMRQLDS